MFGERRQVNRAEGGERISERIAREKLEVLLKPGFVDYALRAMNIREYDEALDRGVLNDASRRPKESWGEVFLPNHAYNNSFQRVKKGQGISFVEYLRTHGQNVVPDEKRADGDDSALWQNTLYYQTLEAQASRSPEVSMFVTGEIREMLKEAELGEQLATRDDKIRYIRNVILQRYSTEIAELLSDKHLSLKQMQKKDFFGGDIGELRECVLRDDWVPIRQRAASLIHVFRRLEETKRAFTVGYDSFSHEPYIRSYDVIVAVDIDMISRSSPIRPKDWGHLANNVSTNKVLGAIILAHDPAFAAHVVQKSSHSGNAAHPIFSASGSVIFPKST